MPRVLARRRGGFYFNDPWGFARRAAAPGKVKSPTAVSVSGGRYPLKDCFWHFNDIEVTRFNVRFDTPFGHQPWPAGAAE